VSKLVSIAAKISAGATVLVSIWPLTHHNGRWVLGLIVSVVWSLVNFALIVKILEIAILKDTKTNLSRILLIKFPLLYVGGFWLLTSKFFPTTSLLAGMPIALVAIGIASIWHTQK